MKVSINTELCTGCGLCVDSCPDAFEMQDDKAVVKSEDVAEDAVDCTKEAVGNCPVEAIIAE